MEPLLSYIHETERIERIDQKRKKNRQKLLALSHSILSEDSRSLTEETSSLKSVQVQQKIPEPMFLKVPDPIKFIVEADKLQFHLRGCVREGGTEPITNLEPFFVTFALYDAQIKMKISADFHAQFNHQACFQILISDWLSSNTFWLPDRFENQLKYVQSMCNPIGAHNASKEIFGEPERKKINYTWIEKPKRGIFQVINPHS